MRERGTVCFAKRGRGLGLRGRYALITGICMGVPLVLILLVACSSLSQFRSNQFYTMLNTQLQRVVEQVDGTYYEMAGLAQQLGAEGTVGKKYRAYLDSNEQFERITLSGEISEDVNALMFSHRKFSLAGYYEPAKEGNHGSFMSFPMRTSALDVRELPSVLKINGMSFNLFHGSISMLNKKSTISVCKEGSFYGRDTVVYVESYIDYESMPRLRMRDQDYQCVLILTDNNGYVAFSSSPEIRAGELLEGQEIYKRAYHVTRKSDFGFSYAFMMTEATYTQIAFQWMRDMLLVLMISIIAVVVTTMVLYRLVYRPMHAFNEEIDTICNSDLTPSRQEFGIYEFDDLAQKIEEMKRSVIQLMDDVHQSEKEKRRLQIDNLYYQINPHFLMNALNSLHWMAAMGEQTEVVHFVHQLNSILSYSLGKTREMITFRSELRVAEEYVVLQQARYDFHFTKDVEEGPYLDTPCARLILQPLLENAICHNMNEFGNLELKMFLEDQKTVRIEIADDGMGIAQLPEDGMELKSDGIDKGIGLKYLQYTLESYYGDAAHVTFEAISTGGMRVVLRLPIN